MLNKMDEESRFPIPGVGFKITNFLTIIFRKEKEAYSLLISQCFEQRLFFFFDL